MNRSIGRLLFLGILGLALSLADQSLARAQWGWWDGWNPSAYSYGVGYYPYWGSYSTSYWPSSYYVGYGSYSLWPSYSCYSPCCGSSCWGGCGGCGSCGLSSGCCGIAGCGSGCCGVGGCGISSCGVCDSGCGLACAPSCGCSSGCASSGPGCGATTTPAPGARPKPTPDGEFTPRTYDPDANPKPKPAPTPGATGGPSGPAAAGPAAASPETDPGARAFSRDRSGKVPPPDNNFDAPVTPKAGATTSPPAGGTPKESDPTFETKEAKKPTVPVQQRGADKKAPITPPEEPAGPDAAPPQKASPDSKKPSAEKKDDHVGNKGPALTLQDRSTWRLAGVSRPLFGRIANRPAPIPSRLPSSSGDWAVFSADETQVVRR